MTVFPSLPGLTWSVNLKPKWNTKITPAMSGREIRVGKWVYPLYDFDLTYSFLRADNVNTEFQTLLGFFNSRNGPWDAFLLDIGALNKDPNWDTIPDASRQNFGTGDGATIWFQLVRAYGAFVDPVSAQFANAKIYLNGVLQVSGYTLSPSGLVTFASPPGAGVALTWSGTFYYLARFAKDDLDFDGLAALFYGAKKIELAGVRI